MPSQPLLDLIPWDPESPEQVERLVEQRIQCGWNIDKPESVWRKGQIKGSKCIYWIVLRSDDVEYLEARLAEQAARFPNDATPLTDTATSIRAAPRTPTLAPFRPIGHIGLDESQPEILGHGFDAHIPTTGAFWIKSLYVSKVLQGSGVGRAAMDLVERMAAEAPLHARHLLLDTWHKDEQQDPELSMAIHGALPKVTNQVWYERRGYRLVGEIRNFYTDRTDKTGREWDMTTVVLRRDL